MARKRKTKGSMVQSTAPAVRKQTGPLNRRRPTRSASNSIFLSKSSIRSGPSFLPSEIASQPLVSTYRISGIHLPGKVADGLRVSVRMCVADIGALYNFSSLQSLIFDRGGASINFQWIYPGSSGYFSQQMQLLCAAFSRYRCNRLVFHYRPTNASTNSAISLTFAASDDPMHPLINTSAPTSAKLRDAGGFSFAAWQGWDWEMPTGETKDPLFLYNVETTGAAYREQCSGVFGCVNNVACNLGGALGQLWISAEIDLFEMTPMYQNISVGSVQSFDSNTLYKEGQVNDLPEQPKHRYEDDSKVVMQVVDVQTQRVSQLWLQPDDTSVGVNLTVSRPVDESADYHRVTESQESKRESHESRTSTDTGRPATEVATPSSQRRFK